MASAAACSEQTSKQMPIPSVAAQQPSPASQIEEENSTKAIAVPEFINLALNGKYKSDDVIVVTGIVIKSSNIVPEGSEVYRYLILGPETSGHTVMVRSIMFGSDLTDQAAIDSMESLAGGHATNTVTVRGDGVCKTENDGKPVILIQDAIIQK
ncbi:MAG: hypothetical protein ABID67_00305 [Candidatus Nealsonbacteria bacterium]